MEKPINDDVSNLKESWSTDKKGHIIESLTAPPMKLIQYPMSQKFKRKQKQRRKTAPSRNENVNRVSPEKSQSGSSLAEQRISSFDSEEIIYNENAKIIPVKNLFKSLVIMHAAGFLIFIPVILFHEQCSVQEASLTEFDNMIAYVVTVASLGCIVYSKEVQNTNPYKSIYTTMFNFGVSYIGGKIFCSRDIILTLETTVIVVIEEFFIYIIVLCSNKDFTPLTPILTVAYTFTTLMNIIAIYMVQDSVPIVMLSIINICLTFGLTVCVGQYQLTSDPRYRLPPQKKLLGALLMYILSCSLVYHSYLFITAMFDAYN